MEVILREHVDNLGRRGDVVKVADGYARNYLLPRKLALLVTGENRKRIERERKVADAREAEEKQAAEAIATRLSALDLAFERRVGENDTLYGSVTAADVAEALEAQGFPVDKRKVNLHEPLKALGEFDVPVKIHREVTAQVKVRVVPLASQVPAAPAPAAETPKA
jgi:large subunit ribosomal protein L9